MRDEDIIRMANQIADFFEPYPADEAAAGVADHVLKFWPQIMRKDLAVLLKGGDERLKPLVHKAAPVILADG